MRRARGFSLVELLVAMSLGVFLSGVAVFSYLGAKQGFIRDQQVARLQENGTLALRLLSRELAMAGFRAGALSAGPLTPPIAADNCAGVGWALDWSEPLLFHNNFAATADDAEQALDVSACIDARDVVPESDLVAFRRSAAEPSAAAGMTAPSLTPSRSMTWLLRVEDSRALEWLSLRPAALAAFAASNRRSSFWEAVSRIYFVRPYARDIRDGVPSLCIKTLAGTQVTTRCPVEGVEQMQLEFGVDSDGDGQVNRYVDVPPVGEGPAIIAARVHLLLRTVDPVPVVARTTRFQLADATAELVDTRYVRRVFSATVPLRNLPDVRG